MRRQPAQQADPYPSPVWRPSGSLREAGIAYAIDQISDLIAGGVEGIHLYTMNDPAVAQQIAGSLTSTRSV